MQALIVRDMNTFSHVPPGFRFHPTDEELVDYYLRKKVASKMIDLDVIKDVDLYKIEPWDLQELCKLGTEEQGEWYFFSHKDKKYPTGTRTNRATKAGFWKATGRDKAIYARHILVGMRKTLVFYKGRAPNGQKSDWIMHEYRLETNENGTPQEEGWVVCRVFKKRITTMRKMGDYESPNWYEDQVSFTPSELDSPSQISNPNFTSSSSLQSHQLHHYHPCKQELELQYNMNNLMHPHHHHDPNSNNFLFLPQLESPKLLNPHDQSALRNMQNDQEVLQQMHQATDSHDHDHQLISINSLNYAVDNSMTDWRVMEKYVASQLSNDQDHDISKRSTNYSNSADDNYGLNHHHHVPVHDQRAEIAREFASSSISSCQVDIWK